MANLKGSTFGKQQRDMNFKLFALGTKKNDDNLTHSEALLTKRDMYFNDFSKYLESKGLDGKFNLLLNEENLNGFLEQRLEGLSFSTAKNYISGFNSLLTALNGIHVQVGVGEDYFKNKYSALKASAPINQEKDKRGLQSDNVLESLKQVRYESYVIGKLILNHGYRIAEAMQIVQNPQKFIKPLSNEDYQIKGVVGKGGKVYHSKILKHEDYQLIKNMKNIPSKQTFNRDLKKVDTNLRAHDFRYQFARNLFNAIISGVGYKRALLEVSKALNHNRKEITKYYLFCK